MKNKATNHFIRYAANMATTCLLTLLCNLGYGQQADRPYWHLKSGRDKNSIVRDSTFADSLTSKGDSYYVSEKNVYFLHVIDLGSARACICKSLYLIDGADPESFEIVVPSNICHYTYAKDKNRVYFNGFPIKGMDPKTFEYLSFYYSKDKDNVFFEDKILNGADKDSFHVEPNPGHYPFATDNNYLYFFYDKVKIDAATFIKGECPQVWQDRNNTFTLNAATNSIKVASLKKCGRKR